MEELQNTVYITKAEYPKSCNRDGNRVFVGWYVQSLKSTIALASYPSYQRTDVAKILREVGSMPQLQHVFRRHGDLSLLEGFSLHSDDKGYIVNREGGTQTYVQVVKYDIKDFRVISFKELTNLGSMNQRNKTCNDVHAPKQARISSYFIIGSTLIEHIDQQLAARAVETHGCRGNETAHVPERYHKRQNSTSCYLEATVCMLIIQVALHVSHCAKLMASAASLIGAPLIKKWLHKVTLVNVLCDRVAHLAQWQEAYDRLQQHTDVVEYVLARHELRQSVVSCAVDVFLGIVEFFFFRRTVVYSVNKVRLVLRNFYVSTLKHITYQFITRIGKYCKVNNEVAVFLARLLMSKIIVWQMLKPQIRKYFFIVSKLFQFSAILGLTCQIAVVTDIMAIETLHIAYAHCILSSITKWTQNYLFSLLQLFKGKKWNELKQALDSNDYTREQLFLGTVIFTLLLLIYPTIGMFYCMILVVYLPVVVAKGLLMGIIEVIYNIPSYFLAYSLLFPNRYKEHVYFTYDNELCEGDITSKKINSQGENNKVERGKGRLPPWRHLEVRCNAFSTSNVLKPLISGLQSCLRSSYFGRVPYE